ncbi:30S ribosomal protein S3 [bacterium]|nr:MAG: 30S ribosomal protein S3 [bacterium]
MTAKVTLSSSAQVDVNKSSAEKTNSTEGASSSSVQSTVNSGADSANNLCDQLLKELTAYRNTRLKKILKSSSKKTTSEIDSSTAKASSLQKKQNNAIPPSDGKNLTEFSPPVESNMLKKTMEVELFWTKVENPNTSAACLAEFIVEQLEKRVPFRRVLKRSIQKAEEASVSGIKVQISGRLNGAEIARSERIHKGQVPLHTLRAKIEYNSRTAKTIYGLLGVKVWVFNGFADLNQVKLLT